MKLNTLLIPLVAVLVALLGGLLTAPAIQDWYPTLIKPALNPPNGIFGPVWTILYIMIASSALIAFRRVSNKFVLKTISWLFAANAVLNVFWSFLFFSQHLIFWALVEMVFLNLSTVALIVLIWPRSRLASLLLVPYVLWVSFATYLTAMILLLNP